MIVAERQSSDARTKKNHKQKKYVNIRVALLRMQGYNAKSVSANI